MELITTLTEFINANGVVLLAAIGSIVTGASILANFTRTEVDNRVINAIAKVINVLALNFKK